MRMRSLRTQLLLSHLALVVLMAAVTSSAIWSFVGLGRTSGGQLMADLETVRGTAEIEGALLKQREVLSDLRAGAVDLAAPAYESSKRELEQGLTGVLRSVEDEDETGMAANLQADIAAYQPLVDRVVQANSIAYHEETPGLVRDQILPKIARIQNQADALRELNESTILSSHNQVRRDAQIAIRRTIWVTAIAIVLAVLLAIRLNKTAVEPLASLAERAEQIASGDLAPRETARQDEIGALSVALEEMASRIAEVRRQGKKRLQRAEQMSDAALEHLYDPVVVMDGKARIVHLNRAAETLFGALPDQDKTPVAEHIDDRRLSRALEQITASGRIEAAEDESALIPIGGKTYRLRATPMESDEGHALGSVAVLEDVTQMKEVDRLKNEFIGVASHELRTPVASLLLSAQMLKEGALGELNDTQKQVVEMQLVDLERLTNLMQDLLDVTKLESGSTKPRAESVLAVDLVKGPIEGLAAQAKAKNLNLISVGMEDAGSVWADRGQIGRVLTNLIANAIRHTREGGTITIRALPAEDEVTFQVEDTGEGIPPEYLARIFDRFVQVPGATQGGAGLGLSIAHNIVRAHGGRLWAESQLGHGSVFSFTLPRNAGRSGGDRSL